MFDPCIPDYVELTKAARKEVVKADSLTEDLEGDFWFGHLCRSGMVIDTLWEKSAYQLTYPWLIKDDKYPLGRPMATPKSMAKKRLVKWDRVRPATIRDRINQVTSQRTVGHVVASRYFHSPALLLQVDLRSSEGCENSLDDLFHFPAKKWVVDDYGSDSELFKMRQEGETPYVLRAAVKHRQGPGESDSIRLFRGDGAEVVPTTAKDITFPDW